MKIGFQIKQKDNLFDKVVEKSSYLKIAQPYNPVMLISKYFVSNLKF